MSLAHTRILRRIQRRAKTVNILATPMSFEPHSPSLIAHLGKRYTIAGTAYTMCLA